MLKYKSLIFLGLGLMTLAPLKSVSAMTIVPITQLIDDFVVVQNAEVDAAAPPIQSDGSSQGGVMAIGGERDLYVEKTAGGDGERVRARVNPNGLDLLRQTIDDASGRTVVTWDGTDGLFRPDQVQYNGLGSVDFSIYDALEMLVTFSDVGGPVRFTFWDSNDLSGGTFAQTTFAVPGGIPAGSSVMLSRNFNLTDFTATGGTLANILDSVGAIQMEIDARATAQEGWDMRIDLIGAVGTQEVPPPTVPEPSSLLSLLALGGLTLGASWKRTKK
jgi:hypothetical protein